MKKKSIGIIGAGPAGIACAIQLRRYGYQPIVYEKGEIGGLLSNANFVENYLGFPFGISPDYLIESLNQHLVKYEIDLRYEEVKKVDFKSERFIINTKSGNARFDYLVIASGTQPRRHKAFEKQGNNKLFYEVLPLKKMKGKEIGIIGAGDAAFDYALNLSINNQVKIFNRSSKTSCLPLLFERCEKNVKIKYLPENELETLKDAGDFLAVEFRKKDKLIAYSLDYIIFATGRDPQLDFLQESLSVQSEKLVKEGILHLVGDVKNELNRQVSIASGDGIRAAMDINQKIRNSAE